MFNSIEFKSIEIATILSLIFCPYHFVLRPTILSNTILPSHRIGYYRDNLLAQKLLSYIFWISEGGFSVFRQDGAPANRARDTIAFLERKVHDFIPPTMWPTNSPDFNPVDYNIVYPSRIANMDELITRLIDEWEHHFSPVDHGCCYRRVAALSRCMCPCERGRLRAPIPTSRPI